jgi:hypothetical protein
MLSQFVLVLNLLHVMALAHVRPHACPPNLLRINSTLVDRSLVVQHFGGSPRVFVCCLYQLHSTVLLNTYNLHF